MRRRRAILRPRPRRPLGVAGRAIAPDPVLHRRDAHASPGRGLATREALIETELDELDALPAGQPPTLVTASGLMTSASRGSVEGPTTLCLSPDASTSQTRVRNVPRHVTSRGDCDTEAEHRHSARDGGTTEVGGRAEGIHRLSASGSQPSRRSPPARPRGRSDRRGRAPPGVRADVARRPTTGGAAGATLYA